MSRRKAERHWKRWLKYQIPYVDLVSSGLVVTPGGSRAWKRYMHHTKRTKHWMVKGSLSADELAEILGLMEDVDGTPL